MTVRPPWPDQRVAATASEQPARAFGHDNPLEVVGEDLSYLTYLGLHPQQLIWLGLELELGLGLRLGP